jgi:predicted GNAT superfamily acetyltransferase
VTLVASKDVLIRPVEKGEFRTCEAIMGEVFEFADINVIPAWQMYTSTHHGGVVLGAYVDDRMVGYSFAYPAFDGTSTYLFSSGLCVLKEHQSHGLGYRLKVEQGRQARSRGYEEIRWTVDPLNSKAMYVYGKLGAVLVRYHREMYEHLQLGGADGGIVADEVEVKWKLGVRDTEMPHEQISSPLQSIPCLTESESAGGMRVLVSAATDFEPHDPVVLEVPWDLQQLKAFSVDAATRWRLEVRALMEKLFSLGYQGVQVMLSKAEERSFVAFARTVHS